MSASNWLGDNRDTLSPDRNNRYRLDNVGLQLGLGVPLQFMGVSLMGECNGWSSVTRSLRKDLHKLNNRHAQQVNNSIQQTVDGIPIRKVYITNINIEVHRTELYHIFGSYGQIMNVFLGISKNDSTKQFAFITYSNPKDASKVLCQKMFFDTRGRRMYALAADSWHQPKEGPNGEIVWKIDRRAQAKQDEESEEENEQTLEAVLSEVASIEITDEGLNVLNDDCLLHIFSFLTYKEMAGVERVCKRWQALSYRMWRCLHELNFTVPPFRRMELTTSALEQYLKRCGDSLSLLDLSVTSHSFNETTIAIIAKYCSNLEVLRLANIYVGNRSLAHLGRQCPRLKQLVMDGCAKFNDKDLMSLLPKCQELNYLDLSHTSGITGKCLANIQGPISNLRLRSLSAMDTNHLVLGLQKMSGTLESLTVSACGSMRGIEVGKIVSAVPNLTSLSLSRCFPQFDCQSLSPVGQLSKLTKLNLKLNSAVTDSVLAAIVEGCNDLTSVNLSGSGGRSTAILSDQGISMLSRLRKLTDLDISYLEAATNVALKSLAARSHQLKRLLCRGCPDLTDDGSVQVVAMCNDLELFDLSGCNNITENTVNAACTSVKMRTNNVPLTLIVGGTQVMSIPPESKGKVPLLTVDLVDLSEEHLRPDFIDDMFFPPSDSDEDDDLDHLCCDCDFSFDDVHFHGDFDDDTPKFGAFDDTEDLSSNWWERVDDDDDDEDEYCCATGRLESTWKN